MDAKPRVAVETSEVIRVVLQMNLTQYISKNRVVLVFTPAASDARFQMQTELFEKGKADLDERCIVVLSVVGAEEIKTRSHFRVSKEDFAVILIGKDGNEKHRWAGVAPIEQIDHRVDRMPMRRSEMQRK
jgi:hypothetical protein